jgi:hypothetical protein
VLAKGLNYAPAPTKLPVDEVIIQTELACKGLTPTEAADLRTEVVGAVKSSKPPRDNLKKQERHALISLSKDKSIMILPADKGRCTVILNREEYDEKAKTLLSDKNTYKILKKDPTARYKRELVEALRKMKEKGGFNRTEYELVYPTAEHIPRFYGLPKIHKEGYPLRPIVSSIGGITYGVAKFLSKILSPMIGHSEHHVKNSKHFVDSIKDIIVKDEEMMLSFDVKALFTSVPVDNALDVIKKKLEERQDLEDVTCLNISDILKLLELTLKKTYFMFRDNIYEQTHGAAMGSPISPLIANMYMEAFETVAINSSPNPPRIWKRYVDDTFVICDTTNADSLKDHINSMDESIQFTCEKEEEGKIAFLDVCINRREGGHLDMTIYRKPTSTNQYLNFTSHHPLYQKLGVVRTLMHRCNTIVTTEENKTKEKAVLVDALKRCGYPEWCGKDVGKKKVTNKDAVQEKKSKFMVVLPYTNGLSEKLTRIYKKHNINTVFKPGTTLRSHLVSPKDKIPQEQQCGVVYKIECGGCAKKYIGETGRLLSKRMKEHRSSMKDLTPSSAVAAHAVDSGHRILWDNVRVIDKELTLYKRKIKEAILIRKEKPELNRDGGIDLPRLYDSIMGTPAQPTAEIAPSIV